VIPGDYRDGNPGKEKQTGGSGMNINCPRCGNPHDLPDGHTAGKKFHFFCRQCGNRVTVDHRQFRQQEPVPAETQSASIDRCATQAKPVAAFSLSMYCGAGLRITGVLASAISILLSTLLIVLCAGIIRKAGLFTTMPAMATALIWLALSGSIVLYQIQAMFCATLCAAGVHTGKTSAALKMFRFDFRDNFKLMAIFTITPLILALPLVLLVLHASLPPVPAAFAGFFLYCVLLLILVTVLCAPVFAGFAASRSLFPQRLLSDLYVFCGIIFIWYCRLSCWLNLLLRR
jgi:hypothetical protein